MSEQGVDDLFGLVRRAHFSIVTMMFAVRISDFGIYLSLRFEVFSYRVEIA